MPDEPRIINACAAAVNELAKTRLLIEALERESKLISERLETEKKAAAVLQEVNRTRSSEAEALLSAVAAKNETIAAKDAVIAGQDKLVRLFSGIRRSEIPSYAASDNEAAFRLRWPCRCGSCL